MAAEDVLTIGVVFFVTATIMLSVMFVGDQVYDGMVSKSGFNQSAKAVEALGGINTVNSSIDFVCLALFIGMILGILLASYFVGGHPAFAIIYMIIIAIAIAISAILSNVWVSYSTFGNFADMLAILPITNHIMLNLPYYMAVVGFVGIVAMFAKPSGGYQ